MAGGRRQAQSRCEAGRGSRQAASAGTVRRQACSVVQVPGSAGTAAGGRQGRPVACRQDPPHREAVPRSQNKNA